MIQYIELNETDFPLQKFGIAGKIIYTPGHTWGSASIILNTNEVFAGAWPKTVCRLPFVHAYLFMPQIWNN